MSLAFNGTTSFLEYVGSLVTDYPVSIFCWVKPTDTAGNREVVGIGKNGAGTECSAQQIATAIRGSVRDGATSANCTATSAISLSWQPLLVTFNSTTNRKIYYSSGAVVTDNTSNSITPALFDRFKIGQRPYGAELFFYGEIAECAVWSSELTQGNFNSLAAGAFPETISTGTLVDSWSLETQAATQVGTVSRTLTATDTSQGATHPISRGTTHSTSGAITARSAVVTGTAARSGAPQTHATSGALAAQSASLTGSASKLIAGQIVTDIMVNNTGTPLATTAVVWEWRIGTGIGVAPSSVTYGSGTTDSIGILTLTGQTAGTGDFWAATTDYSAVYYQRKTVI